MRILMIAPEQFPVPGSSSVEISMLSIAEKLAKDHQVTVLSRRSLGLSQFSQHGNVTIVRVRSGSPSTYISAVLAFVRRHVFDFIQVDNRPSYMAKVKAIVPHTPVSLFMHSLTFVPHTARISKLLSRADLIIVNSHSLHERLSEMFPNISFKLYTVPLGVDISRFRPRSETEKLNQRNKYHLSEDFTILFVGRVIPQKGVHLLIDAAHLVHQHLPVQLVIVGRGRQAYIHRLKKQARALDLPIIFIDKKHHRHIHEVYELADCFVCPSQSHEAFGLVNVEAMASGIPSIASRNGGIPEIISHDHNGYIVDNYHEAEGFANALLILAQNESIRNRLGTQGRIDVMQRFTWDHTAAHLSRIYTSFFS